MKKEKIIINSVGISNIRIYLPAIVLYLLLGVFFDYLSQATDSGCYSLCLGPYEDDIFYVNVIGLRGNFLATENEKNRSFMSVNSKIGFLVETQSPYLSVGVTLGAY